MRRLLPEPPTGVDVDDLYDVARPPLPSGRPRVGLCMVSSLDGSLVHDGRSAGLSNDDDRAVLLTLRRIADVVLVGAGTVRAEGYGRPEAAGLRIGVVTRSGDVDVTTELFTSGAGFLVCSESTPDRGVDALRAGTDEIDLAQVVRRLPEMVDRPIHFVQAEGGTMLNGALLAAGLVDELHLTVSPMMVGGDGPRLATGSDADDTFELAHLATGVDSYVFTRWVRRGLEPAAPTD